MQKAISFKGLRNLMMLAVLATIIFATACKKSDIPKPNIPAPATANDLINTKWEELPVYPEFPLKPEETSIFSFKKIDGKDSIEVTTKDGKPYDYFWHGKFNENRTNTSTFTYSNGSGKVFDESSALKVTFYYSFEIKNDILEIKQFSISNDYHYVGVLTTPDFRKVMEEIIKNPNSNVFVFQNGKILTDINNFEDKQSAIITTNITTTKYKKIL